MRPLLLFAEPFAGSAALSRALIGGVTRSKGGWERPVLPAPVAWMGGKGRLCGALLRVLGLEPGQGTEYLLLNDAGENWPLLWRALLNAQMLGAVIDQLHAWNAEDPAELWLRLRSAGRPGDEPTRLASWLVLQAHAANGVPVWWADDRLVQGASTRLRAGRRANRGVCLAGQRRRPGDVASNGTLRPERIARRLEALVAGLVFRGAGTRFMALQGSAEASIEVLLAWLAADPTRDPGRVVVYLDPPYGGTGYEATVTRGALNCMLGRLSDAGVTTLVSEAGGLALGEGWHALDLTPLTGGDKPEWITVNRPPAWRPPEQLALFPQPANDGMVVREPPEPPRRPQLTLFSGGGRSERRAYA